MKEKCQDSPISSKMNKFIIINPELASSTLKHKEEDVFVIWLISKNIDIKGNGIIDLKELINIASICLGLKSTFVYTKIEKGIDKYWRKPFGKNGSKKIALLSINKVIERLQPEIAKSKPVKVSTNLLNSHGVINSKFIKTLLLSIVAGRYEENKPLSIASLMSNTGLSESTVRNLLKDSKFINIRANYKIILENDDRKILTSLMQLDETPWAYRITPHNDTLALIKQAPNSYELRDLERLPLKTRPKLLKSNDKRVLENMQERRYHIKDNKVSTSNLEIVSYRKTYHK